MTDDNIRWEALLRENERMREALNGRAACVILGELSALVPLKDSLKANETGKTLIDYYRQLFVDRDKLIDSMEDCAQKYGQALTQLTAARQTIATLREALGYCAEAPFSGWTIAQGVARKTLTETK